jgi:phage recombination protein Bet
MANRYGMEPKAFEVTVKATLGLDKCNDGQFAAFLCVANEYGLNPLTKEIYAFPTKTGGIQPIVSIDGWMNLANSHPMFDGMQFEYFFDSQGCLAAIRCSIHRKDRRHPMSVCEHMSECRGNTQPWKQWPIRMLRHKAAIQCIRYAFGFAGIMDHDEYDRMITVDAHVQKAVKNEPVRIATKVVHPTLSGQRPAQAELLTNLTASGTETLGIYTVATLPSASSNPYAEANVSDALTPAMGATSYIKQTEIEQDTELDPSYAAAAAAREARLAAEAIIADGDRNAE